MGFSFLSPSTSLLPSLWLLHFTEGSCSSTQHAKHLGHPVQIFQYEDTSGPCSQFLDAKSYQQKGVSLVGHLSSQRTLGCFHDHQVPEIHFCLLRFDHRS